MRVIIDRFEEDIAVVELDGKMLHAPKALFQEAKEGDTVELTVLPRASEEDDREEQVRQIREATLSRFAADKKEPQEQDEDDPAALFRKLRSKKKRR